MGVGSKVEKNRWKEKFFIPDLSALVVCMDEQKLLGVQKKMDLLH